MKKLSIPLLILLLLTAIETVGIVGIPEAEAQQATLQVRNVYGLNQTGMTFFVNLTIADVTELGGWTVSLKWDPNVTQVSTGDNSSRVFKKVSRTQTIYWNIYEGDFMRNQSTTIFQCNAVDNATGSITILSSFFTKAGVSVTGSGVLARINFTLLNPGKTSINITQSTVTGRSGEPKDYQVVNGFITDQPPPPPPPIWTETWFQTAVIVFLVVVVLPSVVIIRLHGKSTLSKKDLETIRNYKEEIEGKTLSESSEESSKNKTS